MDEAFLTYLIALEVEPMQVGDAYDRLPMHCTLMPRFHSRLKPDALAYEIAHLLADQTAIALKAGKHLAFGPHKQLVTLVEPTNGVMNLHNRILNKLNDLEVQYTERDWVGEGYIPHVTDKRGERLPAGEPTVSKAAYLIAFEHPLQGRRRLVCARFDLA